MVYDWIVVGGGIQARQSLEWCPHLYVTGPLAELEIGPIARNISGARQAAERIVQSI